MEWTRDEPTKAGRYLTSTHDGVRLAEVYSMGGEILLWFRIEGREVLQPMNNAIRWLGPLDDKEPHGKADG